MSKGQTLQDPFLNSLRKESHSCLYLGQWYQAARSD